MADRRWRIRIATVSLVLLIALLACVLPGTASIQPTQPYTEGNTISYTSNNYVQTYASTKSYTNTSTPFATPEPTNAVIIIESSATPGHDIIILQNFFSYTIREGDSFALLARRFCGDEHKFKWLLQVNGMEEGELLSIGREVIIDCNGN